MVQMLMRATDYNILLIEDDHSYARYFIEMVSLPGRERHQVVHAASLRDGLQLLHKNSIDIVVLSYRLPEVLGNCDLDQIVTLFPEMVVLVLTSENNLDICKKVMETGAQECLIKNEFNRPQLFAILQSAVDRQLLRNSMEEERIHLAEIANKQALKYRESKAKFQAICDSAFDGIMLINSSGQPVYCNESASKIFGLRLSEIKSFNIDSLITFEDGDFKPQKELKNGDNPEDNIKRALGLHKNGKQLPLEVTLNPVLIEGELYTFALIRDISELLERDRLLGKSREAFGSIVELSKDGVVVTDLQGKVLFVNRATLALFNAEEEEMIGKPFGYNLPKEQGAEVEIQFDGKTINLVSTMSVWDGEMAFTLSLRDVTIYRRMLEEQGTLIGELQQALQEIKTLRGIIPICSYCRNIRNDDGIWQRIEAYMKDKNPEIDFSHGICESCMEKHHPEVKAKN